MPLFIQLPLLVVMLGEWPVLKLTLRAIPWFTLLALPGGLDLSMEPLLDDKEFEDTLLSRPGLYWKRNGCVGSTGLVQKKAVEWMHGMVAQKNGLHS